MLKDIPFSEGRLVISKDACPFQDVIDGFADAGRISVVTFNISKWNDQVLGALKNAHAFQRLIGDVANAVAGVADVAAHNRMVVGAL